MSSFSTLRSFRAFIHRLRAQYDLDLMRLGIVDEMDTLVQPGIPIQADLADAAGESFGVLHLDAVRRLPKAIFEGIARPGPRDARLKDQVISLPQDTQDGFHPQAIHPAG